MFDICTRKPIIMFNTIICIGLVEHANIRTYYVTQEDLCGARASGMEGSSSCHVCLLHSWLHLRLEVEGRGIIS